MDLESNRSDSALGYTRVTQLTLNALHFCNFTVSGGRIWLNSGKTAYTRYIYNSHCLTENKIKKAQNPMSFCYSFSCMTVMPKAPIKAVLSCLLFN